MLGWLYRIIVGRFSSCKHEYAILKEEKVMRGEAFVGFVYISQCKNCGVVTSSTTGIDNI